MDDPDFHSKKRIAKWLADNDHGIFGDWDGYVDDEAVEELLLRFEKFLQTEEARRMKD